MSKTENLLTFTGKCEIQAAAEGEGKKLPRFSMIAYSGGVMQVGWWDAPVVVDLAGMAIPSQRRPIRLQHDPSTGVGHTETIEVANGELRAEGVISRATEAARDVAESARNGFPWQASIGALVRKHEFIKLGQDVTVNGRGFSGPLYVMRETVLGEISFVDLGADGHTHAVVAGEPVSPSPRTQFQSEPVPGETHKERNMTQETETETVQKTEATKPQTPNHAQPQAVVPSAAVTNEQAKAEPPKPVAASAEAVKHAAQAATVVAAAASESAVAAVTAAAQGAAVAAVTDLRAGLAAETERIAAIRKLCAEQPSIEAKAIRDGWSIERAELEVLRASRPQAPTVQAAPARQTSEQLLQCAVELACPLTDVEKRYEPQMLEAAHRRWRGGIGLFELLLEAAYANGYQGNGTRDHLGVMRFAFRPDLCGGFSTVNISGILSATANKMLLEGFTAVERTWRNICTVRPVRDFKTVSSYRLTGNDQYQKVTPAGEIKHGTLGEESFSNKAETYGLLLAITRQDIINDDLGAISTVPRKLGRGAALKLNDVFWAAFLNNATFFTEAKKNYHEGAATALGVDAMSTLEAAFLNMVDTDGHPLGVNPAILLVPPALAAVAQQLYKGSEIRDTTSSKQYIVSNPHAGKYRVEVSRYLSLAVYTGSSAKAWYLLADPADVPVIDVAFLNGQEAPTVETADVDFNTLGVQMRGYHDFGVALQDCRVGQKAKGEA